ncbi:MAG TPA: methyltransferase domain-containing protein, partial [Bacilli bacterium]
MAYEKFAYVYDRLMQDVPYPEWLRFLREYWNQANTPDTIVELGCGTGNLTIPLAQSGFKMYGIDDSEHMLSVAAEKSKQ